MSIADIIGVSGAGAGVRAEFAQLTAERDRARETAAALEQLCAEREALLWQAVESHSSRVERARVGRAIARHLRETGCRPPSLVAGR